MGQPGGYGQPGYSQPGGPQPGGPQPGYPQPGGPQPRYPQPGGPQPGYPPGGYPQQTLLPQEVQSGRSRRPLLIGLAVVVALVIGGLVAWQLLRDDGESTRAAYCSALKDLTNNGDIMAAVSGADASTLTRLEEVQRLAPGAVKDDWNTLQSLSQSTQTGDIDYTKAVQALTSLKHISDDAKSKCQITMNVPGLP